MSEAFFWSRHFLRCHVRLPMPKAPKPPKSTKLPRKLPDDPIARGVAIMREATGQSNKDQATVKPPKKTKKAAR
jgi:hypothetical protein